MISIFEVKILSGMNQADLIRIGQFKFRLQGRIALDETCLCEEQRVLCVPKIDGVVLPDLFPNEVDRKVAVLVEKSRPLVWPLFIYMVVAPLKWNSR